MCNGVVAVRRVTIIVYGSCSCNVIFDVSLTIFVQTEQGRISLEGVVCEDYYKVRQLLYDQFAIV